MASFADLLKGSAQKETASETESRKKREAEVKKAEEKRRKVKGYKSKFEENAGSFGDWIKGQK